MGTDVILNRLDWTGRHFAAQPAGQSLNGENAMTFPVSLTRRALVVAALVFAAPLAASAKSPPVYTGWLSSTAVGGHDPVAYFSEGKPVAGSASITHQWNGVTWRFASEKNRDAFKADPAKYAPQYGGYCA
jgi:YHS domain-containing protein